MICGLAGQVVADQAKSIPGIAYQAAGHRRNQRSLQDNSGSPTFDCFGEIVMPVSIRVHQRHEKVTGLTTACLAAKRGNRDILCTRETGAGE